jgi:ATP-dependent Clp protease ATP-binding subunit ClpC
MLDDGRVTDSQGRLVSFRNSIVILTSNIGTQHARAARIGMVVASSQRLR